MNEQPDYRSQLECPDLELSEEQYDALAVFLVDTWEKEHSEATENSEHEPT